MHACAVALHPVAHVGHCGLPYALAMHQLGVYASMERLLLPTLLMTLKCTVRMLVNEPAAMVHDITVALRQVDGEHAVVTPLV